MYGMADNDLGIRIRRARERKRWSQRQLADALGVGVRSVGSWERGETEPRNSIGALEEVLAPYFAADAEADPQELEIRELAARLDLAPAEQQAWIDTYRARQRQGPPPGRERAS